MVIKHSNFKLKCSVTSVIASFHILTVLTNTRLLGLHIALVIVSEEHIVNGHIAWFSVAGLLDCLNGYNLAFGFQLTS